MPHEELEASTKAAEEHRLATKPSFGDLLGGSETAVVDPDKATGILKSRNRFDAAGEPLAEGVVPDHLADTFASLDILKQQMVALAQDDAVGAPVAPQTPQSNTFDFGNLFQPTNGNVDISGDTLQQFITDILKNFGGGTTNG